jgi:hypothetical protein
LNPDPYEAIMYNRGDGNPQDPFLSPQDHSSTGSAGNMLYAENSDASLYIAAITSNNGANVFIKSSDEALALLSPFSDGVCSFDCTSCKEWETCTQGTDTHCTPKPCTDGGGECALSEGTAVCDLDNSTCISC